MSSTKEHQSLPGEPKMAKSAQAPAFKWPKTVSQELKQGQKQQGVARL